MNKYNPITVNIRGIEVDRTKVCFKPLENSEGIVTCSDGRQYQRQKDGSLRRIKIVLKSKGVQK